MLDSPEVKAYFRDIIKIKINPELDEDSEKMAKQWGVDHFPSVLMYPPQATRPIWVRRGREVDGEWQPFTPQEFVAECQKRAAGIVDEETSGGE